MMDFFIRSYINNYIVDLNYLRIEKYEYSHSYTYEENEENQ